MLHLVRIYSISLLFSYHSVVMPGDKKAPKAPSPYSVFKLPDLEEKVVRVWMRA